MRSRAARWLLIAAALLLALGALPVGLAFVLRPDGSLVGMPRAILDGTPFADFRIPGLLLATVIGGGTLAAALQAWRGAPRAPQVARLAGVLVLGWIAVQVALIGYVSPLQPAVAALGLALVGLAGWARAA